jgi:predicted membrane-bound spermidine synthase
MKEIQFYVLVAVTVALECGLILAGVLTPLSSYSIGNILFGLAVIAIVIYMGWNFSKIGLKNVAIKAVIAALINMAVISLATLIGYNIKKPVLGISLSSINYLPVALLSSSVANILIFTFVAVLGAWLAQKIKLRQKSKKKR